MQHSVAEWIPILETLAAVAISGMLFLGPVGRSIGEAVRYWLAGGHRKQQPTLDAADLDEVTERFTVMQRQLGELAERQDFTERLLANVRQDRGLPGAGGGAG